MNATPLNNIRSANTFTSMIAGMVMSLGLFMSSPGAASAQELFALSTESGLELYQIETFFIPKMLINPYHAGSKPSTAIEDVSNDPLRSAYGTKAKRLMVKSGLQTTPNGRLTMVGPLDWHPSVDDTHEEKFIASLMPEQTANNFRRE